MKMTKKFDNLNDAFNITGDIVSSEVESIEQKIEKKRLMINNRIVLDSNEQRPIKVDKISKIFLSF